MSGRQAHKRRYNLKLEYVSRLDRWLAAEPPMIVFWRWRKWKKLRPKWEDVEKGIDRW